MSEPAPDVAAFAERVRTTLPGLAIPGRSTKLLASILGDIFAGDEALDAIPDAERPGFLRRVAEELKITGGAE